MCPVTSSGRVGRRRMFLIRREAPCKGTLRSVRWTVRMGKWTSLLGHAVRAPNEALAECSGRVVHRQVCHEGNPGCAGHEVPLAAPMCRSPLCPFPCTRIRTHIATTEARRRSSSPRGCGICGPFGLCRKGYGSGA